MEGSVVVLQLKVLITGLEHGSQLPLLLLILLPVEGHLVHRVAALLLSSLFLLLLSFVSKGEGFLRWFVGLHFEEGIFIIRFSRCEFVFEKHSLS